MLNDKQQENYQYFKENLERFLSDPTKKNKFGVFANCELQGVFDTFQSALRESCEKFSLGDFIIQQFVDPSETVDFLWMGV